MQTKNISNDADSLLSYPIFLEAIGAAFKKLHPLKMFKNPVMFCVKIGAFIMAFVCIGILSGQMPNEGSLTYNLSITIILFFTVIFANFAESIAEIRGRTQADSLRKTRTETPARIFHPDGKIETISSANLKKGNVFIVEAGEIIPADGEIIDGLASIDESAITGESAPVIREAGTDHSSVIGGTKVLSDSIIVSVTANAGESFLDKMIALVEGANRQKTPNELALTILLAGFSIVFLIVCITLPFFADYTKIYIPLAAIISLFVCLIPTTIGGLLSAIGIAGMNRALRANVIAKSGKAIETAGDIDVLLLDKTGTITIGNRKATALYPVNENEKYNERSFIEDCVLASLGDVTPEGKSIVELGIQKIPELKALSFKSQANITIIPFTAETRTSGVTLSDGTALRKGSADAIKKLVEKKGNIYPEYVDILTTKIASNGGTPLVVSRDNKVVGVIELQDIIKEGIKDRFKRLRKMGIKTVMVTGDNPLTAQYISRLAGVDDFIAEARPEDKMMYIRKEQQDGRLVAMMGTVLMMRRHWHKQMWE